MRAPTLTEEQVATGMPDLSNVRFLTNGGQKAVFVANLDGCDYVFKFLLPATSPEQSENYDQSESIGCNEVLARATCEVHTMRQCDSPHLVRLGPFPLSHCTIADQELIVFSEEFIEGETLDAYHRRVGNWTAAEAIRLGCQMADAIDALWKLNRIHRDVKPNNIMRRSSDGSFVLLDMGLVFDLDGESHSTGPVGTLQYFSPEQLDFANRRRVLDFRSDLFSVGVVMYLMVTGQHPFFFPRDNADNVVDRILRSTPRPPIELRAEIPIELSNIIVRLLAKQPNRRFRTISRFTDALNHVPMGGD